MNPGTARTVRLYGVSPGEVESRCRGIFRGEAPVLVLDLFPEVHVRCPDRESLLAVLDAFPRAVYGLDDLSFPEAVVRGLVAGGLRLATAESCTGGLVASMVTAVPGSSGAFLGGVVAYANDLKRTMLQVPGEVLDRHGAVSGPTVEAMASGIRRVTGAEVSLAVSGIAGPGGGTPEKPVGTVWIAWDGPGEMRESRGYRMEGDRDRVRRRAAYEALEGIRQRCLGFGAKG